jgi:protein-disulfide isomerase
VGVGKRFFLFSLFLAGLAVALSAQARRPSHTANLPRVTPAELAGRKAIGNPSAPIRIDEFTDFQCPACRALYVQTLTPLLKAYVATGKVYLVHHDFPLAMHRYSQKAADYADAAAAIGRFEPVERALFTHQPQWEASGDIAPFLAAVLGPGQLKQVEQLARSGEIRDAVMRDVLLGQKWRVHETPTMYITHKGNRAGPVVGAVPYSELRRFLNLLLRQ